MVQESRLRPQARRRGRPGRRAPSPAPRRSPSTVPDPALVTTLGASRSVAGVEGPPRPPSDRPDRRRSVRPRLGWCRGRADPTRSQWTIATGLAGATLLATGMTGLLGSRRRRRMERLAADEAPPADPDLAPDRAGPHLGADPLATVRLEVSLRALAALTRRPETATSVLWRCAGRRRATSNSSLPNRSRWWRRGPPLLTAMHGDGDARCGGWPRACRC